MKRTALTGANALRTSLRARTSAVLALTAMLAILPPATARSMQDDVAPTRSWAFWKTHPQTLAAAAVFSRFTLGEMIVTPEQQPPLGGTEYVGNSRGIYPMDVYQAILWTSLSGSTKLGVARLKLSRQLFAAMGNYWLIGGYTGIRLPDTLTLIDDARAALDGTDVALMDSFTDQLDDYNSSGESVSLPDSLVVAPADPKAAKALATDTGPAYY